MKTTLEIPDALFRKAKTYAASQEPEKPWMAGFGQLADLAEENAHVLDLIEAEFEAVDPSDLP